jgi:hypothetical protein
LRELRQSPSHHWYRLVPMYQRPDQQQHHPISSKQSGACQTRQEKSRQQPITYNKPDKVPTYNKYFKQQAWRPHNRVKHKQIEYNRKSRHNYSQQQSQPAKWHDLASMVPIGTIVPNHNNNLKK